jgi:hypothetical protein
MAKKNITKIKRVKKVKTKKQIRNEELTRIEVAMLDSEQYRGYHIETLEDGGATVRRLVVKKSTKEQAVIYDIGHFDSPADAKLNIDNAAKKFGREINAFDDVNRTVVKKSATKRTNKAKKTSNKQPSNGSAVNLNQQLRDKGLWQKGMQFLSGDEKMMFIQGDALKAQGILDNKVKMIAEKARK